MNSQYLFILKDSGRCSCRKWFHQAILGQTKGAYCGTEEEIFRFGYISYISCIFYNVNNNTVEWFYVDISKFATL